MYLFDPRKVQTDETTFRVDGTRAADLKSRALAAYFAPDEIRFVGAFGSAVPKHNERVHFHALADSAAVLNRLDIVLGQDGWSETYDVLATAAGSAACTVRCTLSVQFTSDSDWVKRSAVGTGATEKAAHREAFERAAVKLGVGRYLYDLSPFELPYDAVTKGPAVAVELPQTCLPIAFRWCGTARIKELSGMVETALAEAKVHADRWRWGRDQLLRSVGFEPNTGVTADKLQNRHCDELIRRVAAWLASIAAGNVHPGGTPFYSHPDGYAALSNPPDKQAPKPDQKPEQKSPPSEKKEQQKPAPLTPPATGAELLARMEMKDRELSDAGCFARGALKSHIIEQGAKRSYSVDVVRWNQAMIGEALKWAAEFIKENPAPQLGNAARAK